MQQASINKQAPNSKTNQEQNPKEIVVHQHQLK